jgi:hypothetical protein
LQAHDVVIERWVEFMRDKSSVFQVYSEIEYNHTCREVVIVV